MEWVDVAIALGEADEAGVVPDAHAARSLLKVWSSDDGWTPAQRRLAFVLVLRSAPIAGEVAAMPPVPYTRGGPWQADMRPERQSLRGRKSGIVRRWRTRDRDRLIHDMRRRGATLAVIAARVKLTRQGVHYVLKRVISAPLPKLAAVKRTIEKMQSWAMPRAILPRCRGRTTSIRNALLAWCGLQVVRRLPDDEVHREAAWLNNQLDQPLPRRRLDDTVQRVLVERSRW